MTEGLDHACDCVGIGGDELPVIDKCFDVGRNVWSADCRCQRVGVSLVETMGIKVRSFIDTATRSRLEQLDALRTSDLTVARPIVRGADDRWDE